MPIIIASLLRTLVMALVTGGTISAIQQLFSDSMEKIIAEIRAGTGINENDALDLLHNFIVDTLVNTGVTFALLKARLPVRLADRLGVGGTGISKRVLTPAATAAAAKIGPAVAKKAVVGVLDVAKGFLLKGSNIFWLIAALAAIIEPGIYKPEQANSVYKSLGIPYQYPTNGGQLQPGPFDGQAFKDYAVALETQQPYAIENPGAGQSVIYSRQTLADLINYVYGQQVINGVALTSAKLIPLLSKYILTKGTTSTSTQSSTVGSTQGSTVGTSTPTVKVFTGVLSQGVLGSSTPFTARPDDLIESVQELQDAASNNLAAALASLPSSLSYELKIVSSVVTREGFKITGDSQEIITGYKSDGTPKYKRVVNKFAVLNIFLINERGTRTKVRSVVLGPTNVLKFNPTTTQIAGIESVVKSNLVTSNTADISSVVTNVPIGSNDTTTSSTTATEGQQTTPAPTPAPSPTPAPQVSEPYAVGARVIGGAANTANTLFYEYIYQGGGRWSVSDTNNRTYPGAFKTTSELRALGVALPGGAAAATPAPSTSTAGSSASTLSEWYSARGQALPSVASRGITYQGLGLGQASFYTGTAEQNNKLLNALKAQ